MGRKHRGTRGAGKGRRRPTPTHVGRVRVTGAGGVVETPEGTFALSRYALREAMPGDTVSVSVRPVRGGETRAFVMGVVDRAVKSIVGTYEEAGPLGVVRPVDSRIKQDFFVLPEDDSARRVGAISGDVVQARITSYPTMHEAGVVAVERRLGDEDSVDLGIQCVMARFDLAEGYPDRALEEAAELELDIAGALKEPLRRDLRSSFALTIDPADARDFDDAIFAERAGDGYRLMVHIADVSHYVRWGSSIDLAARDRATSVYLADRVLPMLPEALCNDLCSLKPGEDRLAVTVEAVLDHRGRVEAYEVFPSVIRSRCRLSYDEAASLLSGEEPDREVRGQSLRAALACADEIAEKRFRLRHERGAVDFNTVEVKAELDEKGEPVRLTCRSRTRATGLVEEAMLMANECVAEFLAQADVPSAYRVHDAPAPESLASAAEVLLEVGATDLETSRAIAEGSRTAMQRVLEESVGKPYELLASAVLLRAMQRALDRPANDGHYALGARAYCHFTSPIRRYPDLIVHRCVKRRLLALELGRKRAQAYDAELVGAGDTSLDELLPFICRHSSEMERAADAAAHASQKVKIAQYYASRVGERFLGTVSWVDQMGVFVRLDGTQAEGLIHTRDLGGHEWWEFDHDRIRMLGTATGRTIEPGRRVVVEISSANVLRGHVDLALVKELSALH